MGRSLALTMLLAVAPSASAQSPCHAENDSVIFADGTAALASAFAIRFAAPSSFAATRLEIFTGEASGQNKLGIWSHDTLADAPGAPLGSGTFDVIPANGWQGASLESPVPLTSGATYWLVWNLIPGQQSSVEVNYAILAQVYYASWDGGTNWNGPFQHNIHNWKFRVFGDCTCAVTTYCSTSQNVLGPGALIGYTGTTSITASDLVLQVSHAAPGNFGLFFYGADPTQTPFGDGYLCIAPGPSVTRLAPLVIANDGSASQVVDLASPPASGPIDPGSTWRFQFWYRDPNFGSHAFNLSNALSASFCP